MCPAIPHGTHICEDVESHAAAHLKEPSAEVIRSRLPVRVPRVSTHVCLLSLQNWQRPIQRGPFSLIVSHGLTPRAALPKKGPLQTIGLR